MWRAQTDACHVGSAGAGRWGRKKIPVWHGWAPRRSWCFPASLGSTTRIKEPNTKVSAYWVEVNCGHQRWLLTWTCLFQINKAFVSFYSSLKKRLQKIMELLKKNPKNQSSVLSSEWDHVKPGGLDRYLLINTKLRWQSQWTQEKSADKSPLVYKNVCYSRHPDCSSFGEHLALLRSLSRKQKKPPCYRGSLKASLAWCQLAMVGMAAVGNHLDHADLPCSQGNQILLVLLTEGTGPLLPAHQ